MRHRHEQWAKLFTSARLRKGWSYTRLCAETGLSERALISACTRGSFNSRSFTLLTSALGILVTLPPPTRVLTGREAHTGLPIYRLPNGQRVVGFHRPDA